MSLARVIVEIILVVQSLIAVIYIICWVRNRTTAKSPFNISDSNNNLALPSTTTYPNVYPSNNNNLVNPFNLPINKLKIIFIIICNN